MSNIFKTLYDKTIKNLWNPALLPNAQPNSQMFPRMLDPNGKGKNDIAHYQQMFHLQRLKQDIKMWREAVYEAEIPFVPHRVKMQVLFRDTVLNAHVMSCIRKRKNLTLLKDFALVNSKGKIDEKYTKTLKSKWFDDMINYILDAEYYGFSMINWTGIQNGKPTGVKTIRKEFISPDRHNISTYPYGLYGLDFDNEEIKDWSLYVSTNSPHGISECGYGLLYEVAMYEIYLRNLIGYNADYIEKYGMPLTVVDTIKTDEDERGYLEDALRNLGASGFMIKDPTDSIQFVEYSQAGTGFKSYADLEKRCENKISKLILGHSDALDSIPGLLGNQGSDTPIGRGLEEIEILDNKFVEYWVNDFLLDKLRNCGINIPSNLTFKYLNNKEENEKKENEDKCLKIVSEYTQQFAKSGKSVDDKWIEERTGIKFSEKEIEEPEENKDENSMENHYIYIKKKE